MQNICQDNLTYDSSSSSNSRYKQILIKNTTNDIMLFLVYRIIQSQYKKKEVLGKYRVIFRKKNSKSKKEYIKYKKEFILLKDYIKLKSK